MFRIRIPGLAFVLLVAGAGGASQAQERGQFGGSGWASGNLPETQRAPEQSPPPISDAELAAMPRDARRTRIIEGFVCNRFIQGQAGYIRYLPGGVGLVGHHEGSSPFRWKVENDRFCVSGNHFEGKCDALPARDLPNERKLLLEALGKGCL